MGDFTERTSDLLNSSELLLAGGRGAGAGGGAGGGGDLGAAVGFEAHGVQRGRALGRSEINITSSAKLLQSLRGPPSSTAEQPSPASTW